MEEHCYSTVMTSTDDTSPAPFTCIWKIENFSDLTYIDLESPSFIAKSISGTVWYLHIDEYAGFFCHIETNDRSEKKNAIIEFEFSFLDADGIPLISKRSNEPRLFLSLLSRAEFLERWAEFTPNNTLTVQCRMWRNGKEIADIDLCYIMTQLKMYQGSFVWAVKEFSTLKSTVTKNFRGVPRDQIKIYPLKPITQKGPFMSLILYLKRNNESDEVSVDFLIEKGRDYAYSCEVSVLDANGKVIASKLKRGRLDYNSASLGLWPLIKKTELIANKNSFLPNDTLLLRCSYEVCAGVTSNEVKYVTPNVSSIVEEKRAILNFHIIAAEADETLIYEEYFVKGADGNGLDTKFAEESK